MTNHTDSQSLLKTEAIWNKFHQRLLIYIQGRVSSRQDADDILQEVFLRIHKNLLRLKDDRKITGWIFRIASNAVIDFYRAKADNTNLHNKLTRSPVDAEHIHPSRESAVNDSDPVAELSLCIQPLLQDLPEDYRKAIWLTELDGLTQRKAAEKVGISLSSMKARVQRGRRKLKKTLQECCEVKQDHNGRILGYEVVNPDGCNSTRTTPA